MTESSRAVVFGEDATSYDQHRPSYPRAAIDYLTGLVPWSEALEVGAGTGLATKDVATEGRDVTCIEPSHEMAEVLRARNLPGLRVIEATFEGYDAPPGSFDLIYAAQAWHWVDRDTAYARAHEMLRPGGALALMWNIPADRYSEFEEVYAKHAPHLLAETDQRIKRRDSHGWDVDMAAAGFVDTGRFTHEWSVDLSPGAYRALYGTYSDHMLLPAATREALLDDLEAAVAEQGSVSLHYTTNVFSGKVGSG